jgi:DNA-binding protein HU-beta
VESFEISYKKKQEFAYLSRNITRNTHYIKNFWEGIFLNKADLVAAVAEKADMSKKDAEKAVNAVFGSIEAALAKNEKVQLVGFGTFEVKDRAERTGRNPQTKETIVIPASKVPGFKAGKALKDAVQK